MFRAKNRGNVRQCRGKIHVRVFFVDDGDSAWDEAALSVYRDVLGDVARRMETEGRSAGVDLSVSWSTARRTISRSIEKGDDPDDWTHDVLGVDDDAELAAEQNRFKRDGGFDEAPIVFVFNKDFRSNAYCANSAYPRVREEWAMLAVDCDLEDDPEEARAELANTLLHELFHLFGAEDLYCPPVVKEAAEKWLPGSVMNDGNAIDDLTRVQIGWTDGLTPAAASFLDDTSRVTAKELNDASEAEWKKKWH